MSNIYKINDEKFKSIYISFNYTMNVDKKDIAKFAVLSSILSKSSQKLKTQKEIGKYLYNLYGSNFDINLELIGDIYNIEFRIECVNKNFLPNKDDVLLKCLEFINEIVYNPNMNNGAFSEDIVIREKESILNKIKSRKDDKLRYAVTRTENIMCENEPFGASIYGLEEDVKRIDVNDISSIYYSLINDSCITVVLSGNLSGYDSIEQDIENVFGDKIASCLQFYDLVINKAENSIYEKNELNSVKEIYEKQDTVQNVLTFGIRIKDLSKHDFFVLNMYNSILGSNPSSKLFQNFREKESLAYTVRSRCYRFKNIIIIYAGIEKNNYDKAKKVIFDNLNEITEGNITDEEFDSARESLVSDLLEWNDSKVALEKMLIINLINNGDKEVSIDDMVNGIKSVKKEDIINFAKRLTVEKIILIGGEDNA